MKFLFKILLLYLLRIGSIFVSCVIGLLKIEHNKIGRGLGVLHVTKGQVNALLKV